MRTDRGLTDLAATLADGLDVDWAALEAELGSEAERAIFRQLRVIADIAELHRSLPDEAGRDESSLATTPAADSAPDVLGVVGSTASPDGQDEDGDLGTWGPYRLLRTLGPGTLGRVVRATDHLHRDVVIRFLPTPSAPEVAVAFLATGQTLARVRHPNAVEVYGAEQHDDQTGLVMEYVDGRSLDRVVTSQGTFSAREAALVGWELCRAIAALHREGLAHGLLSPDNIVREAGGRLVLMDVWPPRVPLEALDLQAGMLPFLAPDVAGGGVPSMRSDIYGLGVVLYYLVSGAYPVRASSLDDLIARYQRGERRPLADLRPDLPDDFIRIVERACDPDPERRYPTIAAVKEALSRTLGWDTWTRKHPVTASGPVDVFSGTGAGMATPVPVPAPPAETRQTLPYGLIAIAIAAVAIGGSVAWSLLPRGTGLRGHSTSLATTGGVVVSGGPSTTTSADVRLALGSAAGADPVLTPLVIEQLAQDLSSSPPFRVIAPIAVEPMLGQPIAAIMQAVGADVYVEVTVSRRDSGLQAQLKIVRAGGPTMTIRESLSSATPERDLTASLTQRVVSELAATEAGARPTLRTALPLDNAAAMQAYWLGQTRLGRGGRKDVEEAADAFRSATEAAPDFVFAYAKWAEALLSRYRHNDLRADEAFPLAQNVISTALSLDDRSAEAYAALGDLYAEGPQHRAVGAVPQAGARAEPQLRVRADPLRDAAGRARSRGRSGRAGRSGAEAESAVVAPARLPGGHAPLRAPLRRGRTHLRDAAAPRLDLHRGPHRAVQGLHRARSNGRGARRVRERRIPAGGRGSVRPVAAREDPCRCRQGARRAAGPVAPARAPRRTTDRRWRVLDRARVRQPRRRDPRVRVAGQGDRRELVTPGVRARRLAAGPPAFGSQIPGPHGPHRQGHCVGRRQRTGSPAREPR